MRESEECMCVCVCVCACACACVCALLESAFFVDDENVLAHPASSEGEMTNIAGNHLLPLHMRVLLVIQKLLFSVELFATSAN